MKLTYEDKPEIYKLRKNGMSWLQLSQDYNVNPLLDGYNSEIIAYQLSTSPNLEQIKTMLAQAFPDEHYDSTILHSDQGW